MSFIRTLHKLVKHLVTLSPCHLVTLSYLLVAGCDLPGKPNPEERPKREDEIIDFNYLYGQNCAGCHGTDGKLGPAPPLNDKLFLALVTDAELLRRVVTEGRPGTPMPAFARSKGGTLTAEQVKALAKGIKPRWGPIPPAPNGAPPYLLAAARNADNGVKAFARACASCHGDNGEGMSAGALRNSAFLSLISDQALRRLAITGRPDLNMPDYSDPHGRSPDFKPLTSAEIDGLVTLLASWRQRETKP